MRGACHSRARRCAVTPSGFNRYSLLFMPTCSPCSCRQKDFRDGRFAQLTSSALDSKLRDDLERLKKIRRAYSVSPRPLRSACGGESKDEQFAAYVFPKL